jgi:hypothetical protein
MITTEIGSQKAANMMFTIKLANNNDPGYSVEITDKEITIHLNDGSNIVIRSTRINRESKLRFFHNIILPTDKTTDK